LSPQHPGWERCDLAKALRSPWHLSFIYLNQTSVNPTPTEEEETEQNAEEDDNEEKKEEEEIGTGPWLVEGIGI
jgi:hypothetical protein